MIGSLITLPWRLAACGAGLALRTAGGVVHLAGDLAGLAGAGRSRRTADEENLERAPSPFANAPAAPQADPLPAQKATAPAAPAAPATPPRSLAPAGPSPPRRSSTSGRSPRPPAEFEPSHVSEERELVEEVAEPGAEDGAGAQVTIAEPWDGYRLMNAGAVIDRLPGLTPAELAGVELYELANRRRKTLLTAVRRELKRRS